MDKLPIGPGTRVTLYFSLKLDDGTEVDSNFHNRPATFDVGDGSLLPGFESAIFGLKAGESGSFTILPEKSFGQHNPSNVQQFSRDNFAPDIALQEGVVLAFRDASQTEVPGVIVDLDDDNVVVDFNHPLAGRTITFDVAIEDVEPVVKH